MPVAERFVAGWWPVRGRFLIPLVEESKVKGVVGANLTPG